MEDKSQKLPSNEFDILPVVELTRVTREFMRRKHKFFAVNNAVSYTHLTLPTILLV